MRVSFGLLALVALSWYACMAVHAAEMDFAADEESSSQMVFAELTDSLETAVTLPGLNGKCGGTGVCGKSNTCKGDLKRGLCAGAFVCCVPKAPVRPSPVTPAANRPLGTTTNGPVTVTADATANSPQSREPVGDLSPSEVARENATPETPLTDAERGSVQAADAKVQVVNGAGSPRIEFDPSVLNSDSAVLANGSKPPASTPNPVVLPAVGAVAANGLCGAYANQPVTTIAGNRGVNYQVVKILPQHMEEPGNAAFSPSERDNTMRTVTACAFDKMHNAAKAAGVIIKIASGFRTLARQQYFWNCYKTSKCNIDPRTKRGRLAASVGSSNHGIGIALDLNQSARGVYAWLAKNGQAHGFVRTVPSEKWHWEYRPGTKKARYT